MAIEMSKRGGRPHELARRVEEKIHKDEFKPDDRLPSERALAIQWKVSRSTVREALGLLVAKGLLTRRHGGGTYVNDAAQRVDNPLWSDIALHVTDLHAEFLEFRRMLERRAAELAAVRHNAEDRRKLETAAEAVDRAFSGDDRALVIQADLAFHQAIADATHNPLFGHLMASLQSPLRENIQFSLAGLEIGGNHLRMVRAQHAVLVKNILKRDAVAAGIAAVEHLDYVRVEINHIPFQGETRPIS